MDKDLMDKLSSMKLVFEDIDEGIYVVNREREILCWNNSAIRITGYDKKNIIKKYCYNNILNHIDKDGNHLCYGECPLVKSMNTGEKIVEDVYLHHKDGHRVPVSVKAIPLSDSDGTIIGAIEIFSDKETSVSTKIKELEELAMIDTLTRISNRRHLEMVINSKYGEYQREGIPFGILFVDIDDFKKVNDCFGHDAGDLVLKMVSNTIKVNLRKEDVPGRWGGEEFVIIITNASIAKLENIARKLVMLVDNSSLENNGKEIGVTVSIGGAVLEKEDTEKSIIIKADQMMYEVKKSGKNGFKIARDDADLK